MSPMPSLRIKRFALFCVSAGTVSSARARHPNRQVAVLIPEMVEPHWYHYFLHNQRGQWLKALLLLKGNQRINVISVPWYLNE